ncbi:Hypothetical protein POVN_LOCUS211 [uncultured virus]|nr:Hypothetical protein POVN_LOCUS211 [uncultured virus]
MEDDVPKPSVTVIQVVPECLEPPVSSLQVVSEAVRTPEDVAADRGLACGSFWSAFAGLPLFILFASGLYGIIDERNLHSSSEAGCNIVWNLLIYYTMTTFSWVAASAALARFCYLLIGPGNPQPWNAVIVLHTTLIVCNLASLIGCLLLYTEVSDSDRCTSIFTYGDWRSNTVLGTSLVGTTVAGKLVVFYYRTYFFLARLYLVIIVGSCAGGVLVREDGCEGFFVGFLITAVILTLILALG